MASRLRAEALLVLSPVSKGPVLNHTVPTSLCSRLLPLAGPT